MTPHTRPGSPELGALIRARRSELGLTIEKAASAAGLGSETWRRYESGGAMRTDKVRGVCLAMQWRKLPILTDGDPESDAERPSSETEWDPITDPLAFSRHLIDVVGDVGARVFSAGSDIMGDEIKMAIESLSSMPRTAHIGEAVTMLDGDLPDRWLMRYNYEFLFRLLTTANVLRLRALQPGYDGVPYFTRSVADDLALHLIMERGLVQFELMEDPSVAPAAVEEWEYELNGEDDEVIAALYSETYHPPGDSRFHFDHWFDDVYYDLNRDEPDDDDDPVAKGS